jgi:hypothetical protein
VRETSSLNKIFRFSFERLLFLEQTWRVDSGNMVRPSTRNPRSHSPIFLYIDDYIEALPPEDPSLLHCNGHPRRADTPESLKNFSSAFRLGKASRASPARYDPARSEPNRAEIPARARAELRSSSARPLPSQPSLDRAWLVKLVKLGKM